ncbi:MAG: PhzF family phenazine biosynthesis protein [Defluviitaleaceae bacterium]|nr:PhzF family phenazine biosynthesis protein [Defluviitaleaceae bacterium]
MKYYIVDAFTDELFKGNQAGVCLLNEWSDDKLMQSIAAENNLAETAFVVKRDNHYDLRWFTPEMEFDLCGHATLASAFIVSNFIDKKAEIITFETKSGILTVAKKGKLYEMDFPSRSPDPIAVTLEMEKAVGVPVLEAFQSRDLMLLVENEEVVRNLTPNIELLKYIPGASVGVIITAKGESCDFVSRYFAPNVDSMSPEDPVTGSAHCTLIPFWSERIGKEKMIAKQLSKRGGTIYCEDNGDRVKISGNAVLYLQGSISVE